MGQSWGQVFGLDFPSRVSERALSARFGVLSALEVPRLCAMQIHITLHYLPRANCGIHFILECNFSASWISVGTVV